MDSIRRGNPTEGSEFWFIKMVGYHFESGIINSNAEEELEKESEVTDKIQVKWIVKKDNLSPREERAVDRISNWSADPYNQ